MRSIKVFILLFITTVIASAKGYKIDVKINGLQDTNVILAHYMSKNIYPDDTARLDKNGEGVFSDKEPLVGGVYIIYLPNSKYFEVLIGDEQTFFIENDTTDFLDNMVVKGSEQNQAFLDHQKYLRKKKEERKVLLDELKATEREAKKEKIKEQIDELNKDVEDHTNSVIKEHEGTFIATFLNALQDVEVPDPPKNEDGSIDSTYKYRYYKNHYFDKFEIGNPRLLRTPIYEDRIMRYIEKIAHPAPDSLIKAVDTIIARARANKETFRFVLIKLFNHFATSKIMGMDALYVHIAEKYYIPEAEWSDDKFINKLEQRVKELKPLLIGKTAPDIELIEISEEHCRMAKNDTALIRNPYVFRQKLNLHDIDAKYIVLYFWERDCGHCRTYTPKLYDIYQDIRDKDVEVVSFNMLMGKEGKEKWIKFLNKHELYDWINAWNPFSYDFKRKYNIKATPQLFILDKDKKIVAKRLTPEQAGEVIKDLLENRQTQPINTGEVKTNRY